MLEKVKIAIVDGHPLVREGLVHITENSNEFEVVAMGETGPEAVAIVAAQEVDVLILELSIARPGWGVLHEIQKLGRPARVLVLATSDDQSDVLDCLRHGASGYALKASSGADLRAALRCVHRGDVYVAPALAARIVFSMSRKVEVAQEAKVKSMSRREASIYSLIRQGHCNKDIGRSLNLSEKTIKHYLTNLYRKFDVSNRLELALLGIGPSDSIVPADEVKTRLRA